MNTIRTRIVPLAAIAAVVFAAGCRPAAPSAPGGAVTVRLAYFPNVTHAAALVGTARGTFSQALGSRAKLDERTFNAGPAEIEALFADEVDIGYIGPGPAVNGFTKSHGKALRVVAGASSGGAGLVVRGDSGIMDIKGLAGKKVASPQVGGTQDISLRHALQQAGLASTDKGGTVSVLPTANPDTLTLFTRKELDAAWVPEPWVARLVKEGSKLLVDERDLWPGKRFASTVVIVRRKFLDAHPDLVSKFLQGHVQTVQWIQQNPAEARKLVGQQIAKLTKKSLPDDVLASALSRTDITYDPLRESILTFADWSKALGFSREDRSALGDLLDLNPLNKALAQNKLPAVR